MTDLLIRGGSVVDGSGAPAFRADVAITTGKITDVGTVTGRRAMREQTGWCRRQQPRRTRVSSVQ